MKRLQNGGCQQTGGVQEPNSCKDFGSAAPGPFDGAKFKWLSANVFETTTGKTLLPPYGIKTFNGVKGAFIGMTLQGTPGIVTPIGVAGLEFRDEAATVNALVPRVRAQGIEAIVVLVHQGGSQASPNNSDINGCVKGLANGDGSMPSAIATVVAGLDNAVDLVTSGHTHAAYNCSKNTNDNGVGVIRDGGLPNKSGRRVPVTSASAFGRILTDVDVTIDSRRRATSSTSARTMCWSPATTRSMRAIQRSLRPISTLLSTPT